MKKYYWLFFMGLVVFFAQASRAESLKEYISRTFPDAKLVPNNKSDKCGSTLLNSIITVDLNGDGKKDYFLTLRFSKDEDLTAEDWIVALIALDKEHFEFYLLDRLPTGGGNVLHLLTQEEMVEHNNMPGVEEVFCEQSTIAFFWDVKHKIFHKVWLSD